MCRYEGWNCNQINQKHQTIQIDRNTYRQKDIQIDKQIDRWEPSYLNRLLFNSFLHQKKDNTILKKIFLVHERTHTRIWYTTNRKCTRDENTLSSYYVCELLISPFFRLRLKSNRQNKQINEIFYPYELNRDEILMKYTLTQSKHLHYESQRLFLTYILQIIPIHNPVRTGFSC